MMHIFSSITSTQNSNLDDGAFVPKGIDKACPRATWPATGKKRASVPITEEQVRGIFHRYDTNRDGLLSKQELKNAFSSLGSRMPGVRAWLALQHADVNGDGYINEAEFDKLVVFASLNDAHNRGLTEMSAIAVRRLSSGDVN
ncbi:hypothetical protein Gotri_022497 [Gossypium trilobum]|uniref:EF-hand domain-containing protein n=1 Tax=Gossypium trilobum TaxID=34281 RepID=A0A7J9DG10_9ROSI|nr:hypothetical protein [Gossypium trilobum]